MRCPNCDRVVTGDYCASCGQERDIHGRTLREYLVDISYDCLSIDGRIWIGFRDLLLYPGKLTKEYLDGKRASRPVPSRLFLVMSVLVYAIVPMVSRWLGAPNMDEESLSSNVIGQLLSLLREAGVSVAPATQVIEALHSRATLAALISVIPLSGVLALYKRPRTAMFSGHAAHAFHLTTAIIMIGLLSMMGTWSLIPTIGGGIWYFVMCYRSEDRIQRKKIFRLLLWFAGAWLLSLIWFVVGLPLLSGENVSASTEFSLDHLGIIVATGPSLLMFSVTIFFVANSIDILYITRSVMVVGGVGFRVAFRQALVVTLTVFVVRLALGVASILVP